MHVHRAQLRFSDTDAMGHINHARFASILEDARIALLRHLAGDDRDLTSAGVILARLVIDYVRPMVLDEEPVTVHSWVTAIGTSSFTIAYELFQRGEAAARGTSVLVAFDYADQRSRPLSDDERRQLGSAAAQPAA